MAALILGLDIPASIRNTQPAAAALEAERRGFDFVSTNDHVTGTEPRLEGWTLLVWLAAASTRMGVVSRVLGVPYRNPALLAKMAESLQRLSGGRLILGLGAGSGEDEYRAMGLPPASPRDRLNDLADTIEIARRLWTEPTSTYRGRRLAIMGAGIEPKPTVPIPIWLGTAGPRGLELVGHRADGWIPSIPYVRPETASAKIRAIQRAAEGAGRDPGVLHLIYNLALSFDARMAADVVGAPVEVADKLRRFLDIGFTGFNFKLVGPDRTTMLDLLASEVAPLIRQSGA
jgi:alkanesulfonate monooxygenase SsuD/methylene tetrahydromethanopterin reductase-like flavin-dependent oxidoreductase (luciferase family)